jgi:hypothetical protein
MTTELEFKAIKIIEEFLEGELGEYSYFSYKLDEAEKVDSNEVDIIYKISNQESAQYVRFKVEFKDGFEDLEEIEETDVTIQVDLHEENWEEITSYDWRVKYFWMTLLKWS